MFEFRWRRRRVGYRLIRRLFPPEQDYCPRAFCFGVNVVVCADIEFQAPNDVKTGQTADILFRG